MNLFDNIKRFFGFEKQQDDRHYWEDNRRSRSWNDESEEKYHNNRNNYPPPNDEERMGFNIFSDPFEIHRYFEQQMNEMMHLFGFGDHHPSFFENFDFPAIEGHHEYQNEMSENHTNNLRDQFLKPGYEKQRHGELEHRTDSDVDGKLDIGDLGSVLKGKPQVRSHFFGHSVTSSTIQKPDGTIEIQRTVKNSDGSEETTITRKQGDHEYTIIKKKDREGQEEVIENFVNIDENQRSSLLKDNVPQDSQIPNSPENWFNFNRYFK